VYADRPRDIPFLCKWFEPGSISSSYSVIVRVKVVLKRTVVGDWRFDNLSGSHLQNQVNSVCLDNETYQNLPRITPEAELLPRYNQPLPDNNLTKDEQCALKQLKNDENIVILPADKGRVTVVFFVFCFFF